MTLEELFPNLTRTGYRISSPASLAYNCFAWAAGQHDVWWEPDPNGDTYWPEGIPAARTLNAIILAYATLGFVPANGGDIESGFEKIALYAREGRPTHAARQIGEALWSSKLGPLEDIEHTLEGLSGDRYGTVVQFLKRPVGSSTAR
jgi:hypothetical protein